MRPLMIILTACAAGCFCRVAAQDIPHAGVSDSVMTGRLTELENRMRQHYDRLVPLALLPDISGGTERAGLYSRRFGYALRDPLRDPCTSCVMAAKKLGPVNVLGLHPIIPHRLKISNGNAANWDNPYPSAYLDARTLSFPMRGIPRP